MELVRFLDMSAGVPSQLDMKSNHHLHERGDQVKLIATG